MTLVRLVAVKLARLFKRPTADDHLLHADIEETGPQVNRPHDDWDLWFGRVRNAKFAHFPAHEMSDGKSFEDFVLEQTQEHHEHGFVTVGDYFVPSEKLWLRTFAHLESKLNAAIVCKGDDDGGFFEWRSIYARVANEFAPRGYDLRWVTDAEWNSIWDSPSWSSCEYFPDWQLGKAQDYLDRIIPESRLLIRGHEYAATIASEILDRLIWSCENSLTDAEIRKVLSSGECADDAISIGQYGCSAAGYTASKIVQYIWFKFCRDQKITKRDADSIVNRLFFIHDEMPAMYFHATIEPLLHNRESKLPRNIERELEDLSPRAAFSRLLREIEMDDQVHLLGTVHGTFDGDIWIA